MKDHSYRNIIVRMPNWIGDIVMATGVLEALKKAFPQAKLTVMCQYPGSMLLLEDPHIDEIFAFKRSKPLFFRRDTAGSITEQIKNGKYDLGILLTNSFSSAWWFYQGGVKERVGYKNFPRSFLLTKKMAKPKKSTLIHQVEEYFDLLKLIGLTPQKLTPQLYLKNEEVSFAKVKLEKFGLDFSKKIIGVCATAAYGTAKCWPKEYFVDLLNLSAKNFPDCQFVFFGDSTQSQFIEDICSTRSSISLNLSGKTTLRELMGMISLMDLFLTNDSGPMHIAQALGVPVVALFGSTSPERTGPYKTEGVLIKKANCAPCFKRVCPTDFRCMKSLTPHLVLSEIKKRLKG